MTSNGSYTVWLPCLDPDSLCLFCKRRIINPFIRFRSSINPLLRFRSAITPLIRFQSAINPLIRFQSDINELILFRSATLRFLLCDLMYDYKMSSLKTLWRQIFGIFIFFFFLKHVALPNLTLNVQSMTDLPLKVLTLHIPNPNE